MTFIICFTAVFLKAEGHRCQETWAIVLKFACNGNYLLKKTKLY